MSWSILKFVLPGLLGVGLLWGTVDRFRQAAKVDALEHRAAECDKAAKGKPYPLDACSQPVAARIRAAWQAEDCEASLGRSDRYGVGIACGAQVKQVEQAKVSAIAERDALRAQLATSGVETTQAIARAEARAAVTADRKAQNDRTIDAAPRSADGRVRCDAQCLRDLEAPPGAARR